MNRPQILIRQISAPAIIVATFAFNSLALAYDGGFEKDVASFLTTHCARCHGAEEQNGERRFDVLPSEIADTNTLTDYQDILDQLNLGEMPPVDEPQPSDAERRRVVEYLTKAIRTFHSNRKDHDNETILRRLNSREYRNTVRDLFRLHTEMFDPTTQFPRDQTIEHLDNVGDTLVTSGYLLQQYLDAAEAVVEKAVYPLQRPETQTWVFQDNFRQQPEIDQVHRTTNKYKHMTLYDVVGADKHEGAYGPIHAFEKGVPYDGFYKIRINAEAVNRQHPYDREFIGTNPDEPLRLGIVPGDHTAGPLHKPQPVEPLLAEIDLADEQKWYTVKVWLDAGFTPRFTFCNGLMDARNLWARLLRKYPDQFPKEKKPGIVLNRFNAIKFGKLPQIHIHEIEIEGPLVDEWPTASQIAVLGNNASRVLTSGKMSEAEMKIQLHSLATRIFRRDVSDDELEGVIRIVRERNESGRSPIDAYCDGVKTLLISPAFLYLEEPTREGLSPSALASRLSYFLWSSTPDDALLEKMSSAGPTKAISSSLLNSEIERMLANPKSSAFIEGFLGSWLTLRDFGSQPPDRDKFVRYYHYDLGTAMKEETRLFARHLLDNNESFFNFLDSDFTFLNSRLAQHYGISQPTGTGFQKVSLTDKRRGGLLGQASILTLTANGIDTSPVVRGVWLLENLLGTPPSPPPPDVEPLDPDIRGAKTIREQLVKHRSIASCNDCHRRIDPMGFALENFDPVGRWRTTYGKKQKIDASGQMPNGATYDNIISFKKILLQQKPLFARALIRKLLEYAVGRKMEVSDRPEIDRIASELANSGNGFRDLVKLVVTSDTFCER